MLLCCCVVVLLYLKIISNYIQICWVDMSGLGRAARGGAVCVCDVYVSKVRSSGHVLN